MEPRRRTVTDLQARFRGPRARVAFDLAICAVLIGYTLPGVLDPEVNGRVTVLGAVLLPAVVLPILIRRRAPFAATCALAAGSVISAIPTFDQFRIGAAIPAAMLIVFSVATRADRRRAVAGLVAVLAAMAFLGATDHVLQDSGGIVGFVIFTFPLCGGIWTAGRIVRSRQLVAEQLAERSRQLHRQREQSADLAVEVERSRLASDLDAASRLRLGRMIDLADGAGAPGATEPTREVFARIERLGRESLNEMRGLLGVLRSDERGERSPRPTLAQIDALLAQARAGGNLLNLEIEGERRPLTAGVELAAFRTLQHALAAVRGTHERPATVALRYLPGSFELEVRGVAREGSAAAAALMAMGERVAAHGGSLSADTPAPGQRLLRVRLPAVASGG